ncbi:invertase inhibitor [Canna indica]|uniref:Invertase inhibitor n=1 Tax=Canna indica TaxID=4628 RepID=A0AAQ3K306_9LILI|nr:invertase inhibitor [Canna indica]
MHLLPFLCLLAFSLSATSSHAAAAPGQQTCSSPASIEDACKFVSERKMTVGYDFCLSSLKKATKSMHSTDPHDLAEAATKLAIAHAMSTENKIDELMDLETDAKDKACFSECLDVYTDAVERMRDALDNISTRVYGKATMQLEGAVNAGAKCEAAFAGSKGSSPLVTMDQEYSQLANIALGILMSLE